MHTIKLPDFPTFGARKFEIFSLRTPRVPFDRSERAVSHRFKLSWEISVSNTFHSATNAFAEFPQKCFREASGSGDATKQNERPDLAAESAQAQKVLEIEG
jgi:hypothetical protein